MLEGTLSWGDYDFRKLQVKNYYIYFWINADKVVDDGQWNDSYSLGLIALKLFFRERIHRV